MRNCLFLPILSLLGSLAVAQGSSRVRNGPWTPGKTPPGWVVYNSKNYQVQSEVGVEKAKRLADHMEVMNLVYRKMFRSDKGGAKQQTIKLFKDEDSFHAYNPRVPNAAAYYSWPDREMVCYDTGKWSDEAQEDKPVTGAPTPLERLQRRLSRFNEMLTMDLLGCAAHEGWHQYFHWYVGSVVNLPSWINEGMGDYFYTAAPKQVKGKKIPAELGRLNDGRLWVLQAAVRQDRFVPLQQLLPMLQQQFYANPDVCYAEGWALCQFLLHGSDGKYAKVIPNYIRLVKDDSNVETVSNKAFKGIAIDELETEFKAWIKTLTPSAESEEEGEGDDTPAEDPVAPPPQGGKPPGGGGG